jgi:asparagine synthase (glutamine-hydrolysing)
LREHARLDSAGIIVSELAEAADRAGTCDELDRILYQDLRLRLPELVLMRLDRLTMAHSVEGRVPFLDHKLVELGMAIPSRVRVVDGEPKHVLKRAVAGLLPAEVVWRPKKPFAPPIWDWLRGPLGGRVEGQIRSSAINELGYLDTDGIREYCARHRSGGADLSFPIW